MTPIFPLQGIRAVMPGPFEVTIVPCEVGEPGPTEILIQAEATAISPGTELAIYTGIHQWLQDPTRIWPKFPFVPGYSGVGRILAAGPDVKAYEEGDRVVWAARHESHALLDLASTRNALWQIADHVPAPVAACAFLARFPLTALVQSGPFLAQSVAVLGLGMIGQMVLRLFAATGAYPLIGIDPVAGRRALAASTPGVAAIDPGAGDTRAALREITGGTLPDIVVDATGAPNAVRLAMEVVTDGGKVVMVGSPRGIAGDVDFYSNLHGRSLQLIGAHGSALGVEPREKFPFTRDRALRLLVHLLESGKLRLDDLITHHSPVQELGTMYEGLLHRRDEFLGVTLHYESS